MASTVAAREVYDAVVVGGGVVGATAAARMGGMGMKVGVVDTAAPPEGPVPAEGTPDLRVFAITEASRRTLDAAGIWSGVQGARTAPYSDMRVWEAVGDGSLHFSSEQLGVGRQLGHIVENRVLLSAAWQRLRQLEADGLVDVIAPNSVKAIGFEGDPKAPGPPPLRRLQLADDTAVPTRLVVAADGANSGTRRQLGIGSWGLDYEQRGVVAVIRCSSPQVTAWQRFLPTGPVAVLPLWGDLASIVWSTHDEHAAHLTGLDEEAFLGALNDALAAPWDPASRAFAQPAPRPAEPAVPASVRRLLFPPRGSASRPGEGAGPGAILPAVFDGVGRALHGAASAAGSFIGAVVPKRSPGGAPQPPAIVGAETPRVSFPLRMSGAYRFAAERAVVIGDAAHTVHPLAGQGLNLGFGDVAKLSSILEPRLAAGEDPGSKLLLEAYEGERQREVTAMQVAMDGIKRTFALGGESQGLASGVRSAGMKVIDAVPGLKRDLVKTAMGI